MSCARNWLTRREAIALAGGLAVMVMIPENPVVGGTVLRRQAIQSPNFITGSAGWAINQDGSAEFNNVVIRNGQIVSGSILIYNGAPAFGNLVASAAAGSGGTDTFGNAYLGGITTYTGHVPYGAAQLTGGSVTFYTAAGAGGPWTSQGAVSGDSTGNLNLLAGGTAHIQATAGLLDAQHGLQAELGATVTGGITADTEAISSGQAAGKLLQVTNTTAGATDALVKLFTAATVDSWLRMLVTGDTNARVNLDTDAAGLPRLNLGPGNAIFDCTLKRLAANVMGAAGCDFAVDTAGRGLQVKEGTNAKQGTAVLSAGSVVVANTSVTANSRIMLTAQNLGTVTIPSALCVSARTAGTSFTIKASQATDTSTVAYEIFEPAP